MIILLTGDNIYEIDQELARIVAGFDGEPERLNVDTLEVRNLTDIFGGLSLFAAKRLVILKRPSENQAIWEGMASWAEKDSDTTVVLVEPKVDKRTKTYKALAKHADVRAFTAFGERDAAKAERWLASVAQARSVALDAAAAREIVRRRGVEQYQLLNTLEQLAVMGTITVDVVAMHIEATPQENVFELLAASLAGDDTKVRTMLQALQQTNDPYMTIGLLASQLTALSGLVLSDGRQEDVASELGISPFVLRNFAAAAKTTSRTRLKQLVAAVAQADMGLKSSTLDPWLQIEIALTTR